MLQRPIVEDLVIASRTAEVLRGTEGSRALPPRLRSPATRAAPRSHFSTGRWRAGDAYGDDAIMRPLVAGDSSPTKASARRRRAGRLLRRSEARAAQNRDCCFIADEATNPRLPLQA